MRRTFTVVACHYHHSNAIRTGALMEADMRRDSIWNGDLWRYATAFNTTYVLY